VWQRLNRTVEPSKRAVRLREQRLNLPGNRHRRVGRQPFRDYAVRIYLTCSEWESISRMRRATCLTANTKWKPAELPVRSPRAIRVALQPKTARGNDDMRQPRPFCSIRGHVAAISAALIAPSFASQLPRKLRNRALLSA
jgi:hypothetical protein